MRMFRGLAAQHTSSHTWPPSGVHRDARYDTRASARGLQSCYRALRRGSGAHAQPSQRGAGAIGVGHQGHARPDSRWPIAENRSLRSRNRRPRPTSILARVGFLCGVINNAEFTGVISKKAKESPLFHVFESALSETLEEGQELLWRTIAACSPFERFRFSQRLLFKFKIGVKVSLGCFHRLVSEPQCDYRTVNAMLQQMHRGAVAEDVRGHAFGSQ